jgi:MoaA/NifB/PqqE/SkfB family radical SAM enzyme
MVVTKNCNLSCGYCNEYDKTASPVPFVKLKQHIDRLRELGTRILALTGGEPLLHPNVFDILSYTRGKFLTVGMISNAYLLTEETIEKLNVAGLSCMQISIDGVLPNSVTVKALKPLRNKLDIVARKEKFMVVVNSVVGAAPLPELIEIFKYAKSRGFSTTAQVMHDRKGQILLSNEDRLHYYRQLKKYLNPYWNLVFGQTRSLIKYGKDPFKCRAGSRYLYINEFGNACWCSSTQNRFHKQLEDYTPEDLKAQFYRRKGCEDFCTLGCVRNCSSLGRYRAYGLQTNETVQVSLD